MGRVGSVGGINRVGLDALDEMEMAPPNSDIAAVANQQQLQDVVSVRNGGGLHCGR